MVVQMKMALIDLHIWMLSPVGGIVWKRLGGMALLEEEVCKWILTLRFQHPMAFPNNPHFSPHPFHACGSRYSSQLLLQHHATIPACLLLPTIMILDSNSLELGVPINTVFYKLPCHGVSP